MTADFARAVDDPERPLVIDGTHPGRPVMIACGGIAGRLVIPPYEFFNLTRDLAVNRIYLRDLHQAWYHEGLPGISTGIDDTAAYLRREAARMDAGRVVVFGNSMGGYAAILFGTLIGADAVHAFSPHTVLSDTRHVRSTGRLARLHRRSAATYFDLDEVLGRHRPQGEIHLYFTLANPLDRFHARRIGSHPAVTLHPFPGRTHNLIKELRDSGRLREIVEASLGPDAGSRAG